MDRDSRKIIDPRQFEYEKSRDLEMLRRHIASIKIKRLAAFEYARSMVEPVQRARESIRFSGKTDSLRQMMKWLNDNGYRSIHDCMFGPETVSRLIYQMPRKMADHLVLECRTRMSAISLSANFLIADTEISTLELEYILKIEEAVQVGRSLQGMHPIVDSTLLFLEAKAMAVELAREQRESGSWSIYARQDLLNGFEITRHVERVFRD